MSVSPDTERDTSPALVRLETLYSQIAGLLAQSDEIDRRIRDGAGHYHDDLTKNIAKSGKALHQQPGTLDVTSAQEYGAMLQQRKRLAGVITHDHTRAWDGEGAR